MKLKRVTFGDIFFVFLVLLLCCVFLVPFLSVLAKSFSAETAVLAGEVGLWPVGFHINAYRFALSTQRYVWALGNSAFVTLFGAGAGVLLLCMAAYPLSKTRFFGGSLVRRLYLFAMLFSSGLIPGYLLVKSLHLLDTLWALILPGLTSPYYLIIMISFMQGLPASLEESARIDGASDYTILRRIVLPLCLPSIASLFLFFAVDFWNDYFRPLIFLQTERLYTLPLYLRSILISAEELTKTTDTAVFGFIAPESIQNATIIISLLPILIIYPFLQRYFVTGVSLGAIKE